VALFVVSLVAVIAVAMLLRLKIDIHRTTLINNATQSNFYAEGSLAWALDSLTNNLKHKKPNQVIDRLPMQSPVDDLNGFKISSTIIDAQGNFNVNNLTALELIGNYIRLIHAVQPELKLEDINVIAASTRDWITPATSDEFDAYYAKQTPPYRAPHRPMVSVSELRLVKGMTSELYKKLLPYVTALPGTTAININTAGYPVLMSLSPTLSEENAMTIADHFKQSPAANIQDFSNYEVVRNNSIPAEKVTVSSNYFLVKTEVKVGLQQTILYTLLTRTLKNSRPNVSILWQTKGTR